MKQKRIVVTGAAGFLGSHLVDALIEDGHRVIGIDCLVTGTFRNLHKPWKNPLFTFMERDVRNFDSPKIPGPIDALLHFASPASPADYLKRGIFTLDTGSMGTKTALEFCRRKRATFLLASTSEVYGDPAVSPQTEEYWGNVNPIGPRSVYDEAKRYAEALTMAYRREYKMPAKIVRIFNTFGPRMRVNDGRAICTLIPQAIRNEPLTVYGTGTQTRSFCYVDDLVAGIIRLLDHPDFHGPVNLGNPEEITINDLAAEILDITESKSKIVYKPLPTDDPKQRKPDISLAWEKLGWEPKVSRTVGLRRTVDYFRKIVR